MLKIGVDAVVLVAIVTQLLLLTQGEDPDSKPLEHEGRQYILYLDAVSRLTTHLQTKARWNYETNITKKNEENMIQSLFSRDVYQIFQNITMYKWQDYQDFSLRRMFKKYSQTALITNEDKNRILMTSISKMTSNLATAKIRAYKNESKCDLALEPDITDTNSKDPEEARLKDTWVKRQKELGANNRNSFTEYVNVFTEIVQDNGFKDVPEWWQLGYEMPDFEEQLAKIWEDVKPLYQQLHAYVRKRLRDKYGDHVVSAKGPIPAHLLDDDKSFTPYPDKKRVDVTQAMKKQNYTALKIFQMSDEFFKSLNLTAVPEKFWKNSMIEKPTDREVICHASAWDFSDGEDFRIKQCTSVNFENFLATHHEMGHIQYHLQYRHQPFIFHNGANPGFQEAIGDTIFLSVSSLKHLSRIHLLEGDAEDEQTEINHLYRMGIKKIKLLPLAYMIDLFRYGVFRKTTTPENYNCHYWRLREILEGVEPPVNRTEDDFDAGVIYHISANIEYLRYFVSYIIQFQFHRALCQLAGEYVPGNLNKKLVNCDIYQSVTAGNALAEMLKMGSSRPWPDAMEVLTGQREMKADALLEYFKPLYEWLKTENQRTGEYVGWESSRIQFCTAEQMAALNAKQADNSKAQTQEAVKSETQTQEAVKSETQTQEAVKSETQTQEAVKSETQTQEAVKSETQTQEAVKSETQTQEAVKSETQTQEAVKSETQTQEAVKSETQTQEAVKSEAYAQKAVKP